MSHMKPTLQLGARFIRWGLGLALFGLFLGFGIIGHYLHGAQYATGEAFLKNMALWYACPWTLSVYAIQLGGVGMVVFGTLYWVLGKDDPPAYIGSAGKKALWLCITGLIGIFCTGYVGYFVVDAIWPQFYYKPIEEGKNAWLLAQFLCIVSYFIGAFLVWRSVSAMLRREMQKGTT